MILLQKRGRAATTLPSPPTDAATQTRKNISNNFPIYNNSNFTINTNRHYHKARKNNNSNRTINTNRYNIIVSHNK
ncbi:hypothetical protein PoB_003270500 [Plakobranchus ocellatus]|uniref:Uncharacterized protein n=1 Tax=Plakobranchus ocellatus TaxID=259542 RepID=A0AAV4AFN8_9GAST|nr:hypothetical protein PoB_003270500 [Plakobranchus ocellatus]